MFLVSTLKWEIAHIDCRSNAAPKCLGGVPKNGAAFDVMVAKTARSKNGLGIIFKANNHNFVALERNPFILCVVGFCGVDI